MRKWTILLAVVVFLWCMAPGVHAGSAGDITCSRCHYTNKGISIGRGFFSICTLLFCPHCTSFSSVLTGIDASYFGGKNSKDLEERRSKIVKPVGKAAVSGLGPALKSYVSPSTKAVLTYPCGACGKAAGAIDDSIMLGSDRKPVICPHCKAKTLKFNQTILWD